MRPSPQQQEKPPLNEAAEAGDVDTITRLLKVGHDPDAGDPAAVELYGHVNDTGTEFDRFENENVAEGNAAVVKSMYALAKAHWSKGGH